MPPEPALLRAPPPRFRAAGPGIAVSPPEHPRRFGLAVPYSIANVGPGFDRFGLALARPTDRLEVFPAHRDRLELCGEGGVPARRSSNAVTVAFDAFGGGGRDPGPVRLRLTKGFRAGTGLGSSGASAAAGALAAALVRQAPLDDPGVVEAIAEAAAAGEEAACGSRHLDNLLPSLFGGFTLLERLRPLTVLRLWPELPARIVLAVPLRPLATRDARAVLPDRVPREDAVENVAHAAGLVHALLAGDALRAGANLDDRLAEPYRVRLVPGFGEARRAALAAGAYGAAMAGSGPAIFAFAPVGEARRVAAAVRRAFHRAGNPCATLVTRPGAGPVRSG